MKRIVAGRESQRHGASDAEPNRHARRLLRWRDARCPGFIVDVGWHATIPKVTEERQEEWKVASHYGKPRAPLFAAKQRGDGVDPRQLGVVILEAIGRVVHAVQGDFHGDGGGHTRPGRRTTKNGRRHQARGRDGAREATEEPAIVEEAGPQNVDDASTRWTTHNWLDARNSRPLDVSEVAQSLDVASFRNGQLYRAWRVHVILRRRPADCACRVCYSDCLRPLLSEAAPQWGR
eukprot:scaffold1484_cov241-Pinguiococcus_pyrenoidosus.AAC.15